MTSKVKVGKTYRFDPVMFDVLNPSIPEMLKNGDLVKVINKPGCPKANTMGMCYVEKNGIFAGMVCTGSLVDQNI